MPKGLHHRAGQRGRPAQLRRLRQGGLRGHGQVRRPDPGARRQGRGAGGRSKGAQRHPRVRELRARQGVLQLAGISGGAPAPRRRLDRRVRASWRVSTESSREQGYWIARVDVSDPVAYDKYRPQRPAHRGLWRALPGARRAVRGGRGLGSGPQRRHRVPGYELALACYRSRRLPGSQGEARRGARWATC